MSTSSSSSSASALCPSYSAPLHSQKRCRFYQADVIQLLREVTSSLTIVSGIWSNRRRGGTAFFLKAKIILEVFTLQRFKIENMHAATQSSSGKTILSFQEYQEKQVLHIYIIIISVHGKSFQIFKIIVHVNSKNRREHKTISLSSVLPFRHFSFSIFARFTVVMLLIATK